MSTLIVNSLKLVPIYREVESKIRVLAVLLVLSYHETITVVRKSVRGYLLAYLLFKCRN